MVNDAQAACLWKSFKINGFPDDIGNGEARNDNIGTGSRII